MRHSHRPPQQGGEAHLIIGQDMRLTMPKTAAGQEKTRKHSISDRKMNLRQVFIELRSIGNYCISGKGRVSRTQGKYRKNCNSSKRRRRQQQRELHQFPSKHAPNHAGACMKNSCSPCAKTNQTNSCAHPTSLNGLYPHGWKVCRHPSSPGTW